MSPRIGGVYTKSYDSTLLTTSSLLTAFSDHTDGKEDRPRFWSDEEYLWYLDGFAHAFGIYEKVRAAPLVSGTVIASQRAGGCALRRTLRRQEERGCGCSTRRLICCLGPR